MFVNGVRVSLWMQFLEVLHAPEGEGAGAGAGEGGTGGGKTGGSGAGGAPGGDAGGGGGGKALAGAGSESGDVGGSEDGGGTGGDGKGGSGDTSLVLTDSLREQILAALPKDYADKGKSWLSRRGSLVDVIRSGLAADSKISELSEQLKAGIKPPGKDAKPEERAAYRKQMGIPDSADKYAVYRPNGYEPDDAAADSEKMFVADAFEADLTQQQLDRVMKSYYTIQAAQQQRQKERVEKASEAAYETARAKYGSQYKAKTALGDRYLENELKPYLGDNWNVAMSFRNADGVALGEMPGFVDWVIDRATAWAEDDIPGGESPGAGGTLQDQIDADMALYGTEKYASVQERLQANIAKQLKMKERSGGSR